MRKVLLITFLILFFVNGIEAQLQNKSNSKDIISSDLEIGSNGLHRPGIPGQSLITFSAIGPAYLLGDLGVLPNSSDISLSEITALYSVGLQHIFPNNVGIKAAVYYGTFKGTDVGTIYEESRGYSFQSTLYEFGVQGEYILLGGPFSKRSTPHTFYVFAGAGLMYSDATVYLSDATYIDKKVIDNINVYPHPGDKVQPKTLAPVFPLGFGYQFRFTSKFSLGAEYGYHYIISDYIDGIHTKEGINNDVLAALTFTFTYKFAESGPSSSLKNRCNCVWQ